MGRPDPLWCELLKAYLWSSIGTSRLPGLVCNTQGNRKFLREHCMGPSLLVWLSSLQVKLVFVTMEKTLILNVSGPVCCTQVLTRDTIFELSSSQVGEFSSTATGSGASAWIPQPSDTAQGQAIDSVAPQSVVTESASGFSLSSLWLVSTSQGKG